MERNGREPLWMMPHLLGMDVAAAACAWSCVCAEFMLVRIVGSGALMLLAVAAWVCVVLNRLYLVLRGEYGGYADFYRRHVFWLLPLVLCAALAAIWMLFYYVGQGLLIYVPFVVLPLVSAALLPGVLVRCFALAVAFVAACYAPGFFYSMLYAVVDMFFSARYWAVVGVLFLFVVHRRARAKRWDVVLGFGCFVAFIWLLISLLCAPAADKGFFCMLLLAVACLHVLRFRLLRFGREYCDAADWSVLALCAIVGWIVFAPGG